MKSPILTINYKFCDFLPTCLQTCSCKMYFVVHKFPNLSKVVIHLGTHAHPVANEKCREFFQEMKNTVVDEVYRTLIATTLAIALSISKTFLFCHLSNEDGKGLLELFEGEKLDQTLLKFTPLCSLGIGNGIASLKHHPNYSNFVDYILKLKAISTYDYIENNCFPSQHVMQKVYLFKMSVDGDTSEFDLVQ